jgi:hypothetical protein
VTLTFLDTSVLIAAHRGAPATKQQAAAILADTGRTFVSSDFVRLELLPKARYYGHTAEVAFYDTYFASVAVWVTPDAALVQEALRAASATGMSALDALHVAAAVRAGAGELITTEGATKPLHRARGVRVVTLQP